MRSSLNLNSRNTIGANAVILYPVTAYYRGSLVGRISGVVAVYLRTGYDNPTICPVTQDTIDIVVLLSHYGSGQYMETALSSSAPFNTAPSKPLYQVQEPYDNIERTLDEPLALNEGDDVYCLAAASRC